jgi:hypothetical protein
MNKLRIILIVIPYFLILCFSKVYGLQTTEKKPDSDSSADYPFKNLSEAFSACEFKKFNIKLEL